jgi:hypothetical protein
MYFAAHFSLFEMAVCTIRSYILAIIEYKKKINFSLPKLRKLEEN